MVPLSRISMGQAQRMTHLHSFAVPRRRVAGLAGVGQARGDLGRQPGAEAHKVTGEGSAEVPDLSPLARGGRMV
jgi:hypothetical protein